jgi:hypothetical protein
MKRKPHFVGTRNFSAVVTKRTTGWFLFRKRIYKVIVREGFYLQDEEGICWRPVMRRGVARFASDGATVPWPINRFFAGDPLHFQYSCMGIHDPACTYGFLERMDPAAGVWEVVRVPRSQADSLMAQGITAEEGLRITRLGYHAGVRIGSFFGVGVRHPRKPSTLGNGPTPRNT